MTTLTTTIEHDHHEHTPRITPRRRAKTAGRERTCHQCGITYRAPNANSRFCSARCVKRHQRASRRGGQKEAYALRSWLLKRGYAGKHSPWDEKNRRRLKERWGLTVPVTFALDELNDVVRSLHGRGLHSTIPTHSEATFRTALKAAAIAAA
jgi:hypothetical protein